MINSRPARRCSCPCPAPLPLDSPCPDFSIGTWCAGSETFPNLENQWISSSAAAYFPSRSYGSNDSGLFSTSPISTNSSNSTPYESPSLAWRKCIQRQNCDVITDTLNQLTLQGICRSVPSEAPSESTLPSRYARWAGIAIELESWEKRLSTGWSSGQIPRSQLTSFVEFLKRLRMVVRRKSEEGLDLCAFCRNNGEPFEVYISHKVRNISGQVTCPILRLLSCPLCKSTGDQAHTIKYCPYRKKKESSQI